MNSEVSEYINNAPVPQRAIMNSIRQLIHESVQGTTEAFKWSRPVFGLGKDFAYLKVARDYVTVGFFNFEKLKDPDNRLEGTGKDMRHIKIKTFNDSHQDLLKEWFKAAAE